MVRPHTTESLIIAPGHLVARAVYRTTLQAIVSTVTAQDPYEWVEARTLAIGDYVQSIHTAQALDPTFTGSDGVRNVNMWRKIVHIAADGASCRAHKISMAASSSDPCIFANGVLVRCAAMV